MKTDTYLSDVDLSKRWGVARPTVWRWHKEDKSFPRCVKRVRPVKPVFMAATRSVTLLLQRNTKA